MNREPVEKVSSYKYLGVFGLFKCVFTKRACDLYPCCLLHTSPMRLVSHWHRLCWPARTLGLSLVWASVNTAIAAGCEPKHPHQDRPEEVVSVPVLPVNSDAAAPYPHTTSVQIVSYIHIITHSVLLFQWIVDTAAQHAWHGIIMMCTFGITRQSSLSDYMVF